VQTSWVIEISSHSRRTCWYYCNVSAASQGHRSHLSWIDQGAIGLSLVEYLRGISSTCHRDVAPSLCSCVFCSHDDGIDGPYSKLGDCADKILKACQFKSAPGSRECYLLVRTLAVRRKAVDCSFWTFARAPLN
jgi:hypothetical protein